MRERQTIEQAALKEVELEKETILLQQKSNRKKSKEYGRADSTMVADKEPK